MARSWTRAGRAPEHRDGGTRILTGGRTVTARVAVPPARPPVGGTRADGTGSRPRIQGDGRTTRRGCPSVPARTGRRSPRIHGEGRTSGIGGGSPVIHGDARGRRAGGGSPRFHGDGGGSPRIRGDGGGSPRIRGDGGGRRLPGAGVRPARRDGPDGRADPGGELGHARDGGSRRDGRARNVGPWPHRGDGRHGPAADRLRTALRLAARATRRFARTAGQAATASVATADPRTRTAPVRPAARAAPRRRYAARAGPGAPVLVIGTLMMLIIVMLGVERATGVTVLPDRLFAGLRPPPKEFPVLAASPPTDLTISKLGLRAPVHRVGIAADGTIAVPPLERAGEAGWYEQGPTPGQNGPAVIVGHVDTTTGPAVFHDLKKLEDGDRVEVTREDHSVAVFEVTSVERYGKERLPVDEIFGDFSRPNLRLITCGGRWVGGETGYADNLVVYASLVEARGP